MSSRNYYSFAISTALLAIGYFIYFENIFVGISDTFSDESLQRPEVSIPQGKILGINMVTRLKRKIYGFKGIPFAQPPVKNLRFKAPEPATSWNGTLDGSIDSKLCPQLKGETFIGDEDCLQVNVYTPQLPVAEKLTLLPVMIFVFGGSFMRGSNNPAQYGPRFVLDKDVVLVLPNYRMGVLGWLSTGDEISPGNYGLKDLVLALKWTQDNIRYFGGDPDRVTLVGASAGAASVHLLTLSDLTKGLFHRYVTQSGSALAFIACRSRKAFAKRATQLGEYLGCPTDTSAVLVDCLRGLNTEQLVNTKQSYHVWNMFPNIVWGPTIEPEMEGALFTDSPANLISVGKIRDLPWLQSVNRDEGIVIASLFYEKPNVYQEFFNNLDTLLPIVLQYDGLVDDVTTFTDALKSYYLNNLTADADTLLTNLTQIIGDLLITYPAHIGSQQYLIHAKKPHFFCSFEYRGTASYSYMYTGGSTKDWGVAHGDERLYIFSGEKSCFGPPGWEYSENDSRMVDTTVQLWTSFVINGIPTTSDPNDSVVWEPYSSEHNYLRIGSGSDVTLEVGYNLLQDRMKFLENLFATTLSRNYL